MGRRMKLNESQLRRIVRTLMTEKGGKLGVDFEDPKHESNVIATDDEGSLVAEGWGDSEGYEDDSEAEEWDGEPQGPWGETPDDDLMARELRDEEEEYERGSMY